MSEEKSSGSGHRETIIAKAIYRALKRNKGAFVVGGAGKDDRTIIDGTFSIRHLARAVDRAIAASEERI